MPPHVHHGLLMSIDYRQSGVDIDAGNEVVRRIKAMARTTYTTGVLSGVGSFGGLFALDPAVADPVLVASADGVGTKLKVAFMAGVHDTIGADLVNHCVNDILVQGARPLFFLDYLATGRLSPDVAELIVRGSSPRAVTTGVRCSAARPPRCRGFTPTASTTSPASSWASCRRPRIIDGQIDRPGRRLDRAAIRRVCTPTGIRSHARLPSMMLGLQVRQLTSMSWARRSAPLCCVRTARTSKPIAPLLEAGWIKGMAHITGGGLTENVPRTLPAGLSFALDRQSWVVPPLFTWLQRGGGIDDDEMFRTFNMGVGLVLVAGRTSSRRSLRELPEAWVIGHVTG